MNKIPKPPTPPPIRVIKHDVKSSNWIVGYFLIMAFFAGIIVGGIYGR